MKPTARHAASWALALGGCVAVVAVRVAVGDDEPRQIAQAPARVITVPHKRVVVVGRRERRPVKPEPRPSADARPQPETAAGRNAPKPRVDRPARHAPAATATPRPRATPTPVTARPVDGAAIATRYGPVQVRVVLTGRHIDDVITLAAPNDVPRSRQITADAVPLLRSQTLSAQSAAIDGVAGATYTAAGYRQSVQSALDVA